MNHLTEWGWPETKVVIMAPTNAGSSFRELLEAMARGEFAQVVEVEMQRLERKDGNAENSN